MATCVLFLALSVRAISTLVPICWTRQSRNTDVQLIKINYCLTVYSKQVIVNTGKSNGNDETLGISTYTRQCKHAAWSINTEGIICGRQNRSSLPSAKST